MGNINTIPGISSYESSKSAINRFTEFVHYEYEQVRVFAYHPGCVGSSSFSSLQLDIERLKLLAPHFQNRGVMTKLAGNMPKAMHHILNDEPELAGAYALWLATQPQADFLRGRFSSCNWVSKTWHAISA